MFTTTSLMGRFMQFRKVSINFLLFAFVALGSVAHAQNYPSKRISMVVPWPASGATDIGARRLANEIQESLGHPIIVENFVGAGGSIGTTKALKAPADGHTLLISSPVDVVLAPFAYKSAHFKAEDAQTVAMLSYSSIMVVVRPTLSAQTLTDLVKLMQSPTDKPLSYCTPGVGTVYPMLVERMNSRLQTKNIQVPYPGFGQCLTDLAGERIDFALLPISGQFSDFVENGKVRPLAVLSDKPNARFPKLPLANAIKGFEDLNILLWTGVHVNSAVPAAIVEQLNKIILAALAKPDLRKKIEGTGASVFEPMTPQQAHAFYLNEVKLLGGLAQSVGIVKQ